MSDVEIPFNDWSKSKLGLWKVCTSRSKKYCKKGDTFSVAKNGTTLQFEIIDVVKLPLWMIIEYLYVAEGADDSDELKRVWKEIHPSFDYEKDRDKEYWVHFFKEVGRMSLEQEQIEHDWNAMVNQKQQHGAGKCVPASALDPLFEAAKKYKEKVMNYTGADDGDDLGADDMYAEIEKLEKLRGVRK